MDDGWQILLVDNHMLSATALQKVLNKEENVSKVFVAQDIEQTLHKLRDLPINLLVVESRFYRQSVLRHFTSCLSLTIEGRSWCCMMD